MMNITVISNTIIIACTAITAVLAIIEKAQGIKWNPITKLLHGNLEERLVRIEKKVDMAEIGTVRSRISSTATLIKNNGKLTKDQYECIFKDIDKWEKYHEEYNDLNGIINISIEIIKEAYKKETFEEKTTKASKE